jgi:hypothetical protein
LRWWYPNANRGANIGFPVNVVYDSGIDFRIRTFRGFGVRELLTNVSAGLIEKRAAQTDGEFATTKGTDPY